MKSKLLSLLLIAPLATLSACSSVNYGDPEGVETVSIAFGSTDLQTLAGGMAKSLIDEPNLNYLDHSGKGDDKRIIVYFGGIENRTDEHIDSLGIRDEIRATLFEAKKFRFVADTQGQDEIGEQVRFQQGSGRVDPDQARATGKQIGADVIIYGRLISITKKEGGSLENLGTRTKDVYYQFGLECVNIETGELLWAKTEKVRKSEKKGPFGG